MRIGGIKISDQQWSALEMMREKGLSYIPTSICHGSSMADMERKGLIEKSPLPGWWSPSEIGKNGAVEMVAASKKAQAGSTANCPFTPPLHVRKRLLEAKAACVQLRPRQRIFGRLVRESAVEFLATRKLNSRFIFFAYPMGYPLKHIAWALQDDTPKITATWVGASRYDMGIPSRRSSVVAPRPKVDADLFSALIDEGCTEEEIFEYFASMKNGDPVF